MSDGVRLDEVKAAIQSGGAVIIAGAGLSAAATQGASVATWAGLLRSGIEYCLDAGLANSAWKTTCLRLLKGDNEQYLAVAELLTTKLGGRSGGEYARWLAQTVGRLESVDSDVINALAELSTPVVTTNYDTLIETVVGARSITWRDPPGVDDFLRRQSAGVFHMHGVWSEPESVVLGIRSYEALLSDALSKAAMTALFATRTIVFVGVGLSGGFVDPNFTSLRRWLRLAYGGTKQRHYILLVRGDMRAARELLTLEDRILPVCYGNKHADLPHALTRLSRNPAASRRAKESLGRHCRSLMNFASEQARLGMGRALTRMLPLRVADPLEDETTHSDRPLAYRREKYVNSALKPCVETSQLILRLPTKGILFLVGEAGAGKTITLLMLAQQMGADFLNCEESGVPIYAPIDTWQPNEGIFAWLARVATLPVDLIVSIHDQRKLLLLLDGFDELGFTAPHTTGDSESLDDRDRKVRDAFLTALSSVESLRAVVSSRDTFLEQHDLTRLSANVRIAKLEPLTVADIQAAVVLGADVLRLISGNSDVRELLSNPLMFSLWANTLNAPAIGEIGLSQHQIKRRIISEYVRTSIQAASQQAGDQEPFGVAEFTRKLELIAANMCDHGRTCTNLRVPAIQSLSIEGFSAFCRDAIRTGILVRSGGSLRFRHLIFRDYFALEFSMRHLNSADPMERAEAVQTMLMLNEAPPAQCFQMLFSDLNDHLLLTQSALMLLRRSGDPTVVPALLSAIPRIANDPMAEHYLQQALRKIAETVPTSLVDALYSHDKRVMDLVGPIIEDAAGPALIAPLNVVLERTANSDARWWAVRLLAKVGDPARGRARDACLSPNAQLRSGGMSVLASIGSPEDIAIFRAGLLDPSPAVSAAACAGVGVTGSWDQDAHRLILLLENAPSDVAAEAAGALAALYSRRPASLTVEATRPAIHQLKSRLNDSVQIARMNVVRALSVIDPSGSIEDVFRALYDHEASVVAVAAEIIVDKGGPAAVDRLWDALNSIPESQASYHICLSLKKLAQSSPRIDRIISAYEPVSTFS